MTPTGACSKVLLKTENIENMIKCPLRFLVAEAKESKVYPKDVKKFLMGLYATLHITDGATNKDVERLVFYAFRNGYVLGAQSQGASAQDVYDKLPDFGMDEEIGDDARR